MGGGKPGAPARGASGRRHTRKALLIFGWAFTRLACSPKNTANAGLRRRTGATSLHGGGFEDNALACAPGSDGGGPRSTRTPSPSPGSAAPARVRKQGSRGGWSAPPVRALVFLWRGAPSAGACLLSNPGGAWRPAPGGAAPRGCICSRRSPRRRGRAHVERRAVPPVSLCSSTPHAHPLARRSADCRGRCHWPRQKLVAAHTGEYGNNSDLNVSS